MSWSYGAVHEKGLILKEDDFKKIQEFIRKHYNDFQHYFNNEIDIEELRSKVYVL